MLTRTLKSKCGYSFNLLRNLYSFEGFDFERMDIDGKELAIFGLLKNGIIPKSAFYITAYIIQQLAPNLLFKIPIISYLVSLEGSISLQISIEPSGLG